MRSISRVSASSSTRSTRGGGRVALNIGKCPFRPTADVDGTEPDELMLFCFEQGVASFGRVGGVGGVGSGCAVRSQRPCDTTPPLPRRRVAAEALREWLYASRRRRYEHCSTCRSPIGDRRRRTPNVESDRYDLKVKVDVGSASLTGTVATAVQRAEAARPAKIDEISAECRTTSSSTGTSFAPVADHAEAGMTKTGEAVTDGWITTRQNHLVRERCPS